MNPSLFLRVLWLVPGSVIAIVGLLWGTMGTVGLLAYERQTVRQVVEGPVATVAIDTDGNVRVTGEDRQDVAVELVLVTGLAGEPAHAVRLEGGRLTIDGDCPGVSFGWCSVGVTVRVPAAVAVEVAGAGGVRITEVAGGVLVDIDGGEVTLDGIEGGIDARTRGGGVTATDAGGPLRIRSGGGAIEGRGLRADVVDIETAGGGIELFFAVEPQRVAATTGGGAVRIEVPQGGAAYAVDVSTSGGGTSADVRTDPSSERVISAHSNGGRVEVAYRGSA